jgi:hypothetical protein
MRQLALLRSAGAALELADQAGMKVSLESLPMLAPDPSQTPPRAGWSVAGAESTPGS